MKRYKKTAWLPWQLLLPAMMFTGCEDSRMVNMVNDKIYLVNDGLNPVDVFNWEGFTYNLYVIKSGIGQAGAEVELKVDAARLEAYNKQTGDSLMLLPESSYTLKRSRLSLAKEDYRVPFEIVFDPAGIRKLEEETRKRYAIPFVMSKTGGNTDMGSDAQMFSLVVPAVKEPYLQFSVGGLSSRKAVIDHTSSTEPWFYSFVSTNYPHDEEVRYEIKQVPEALEQYNKEHGTDYRLFPASAWSLDEASVVVGARSKEQAFRFKIFRDKLKGADGQALSGEYYIPLRLESVSKYKINPDKAVQLIPVVVQL